MVRLSHDYRFRHTLPNGQHKGFSISACFVANDSLWDDYHEKMDSKGGTTHLYKKAREGKQSSYFKGLLWDATYFQAWQLPCSFGILITWHRPQSEKIMQASAMDGFHMVSLLMPKNQGKATGGIV